MKVAVIGAGGFVGQKVSEKLAEMPEFAEIALIDQIAFDAPRDRRVSQTIGSFADPALREQTLTKVDKVIVLAAILGGAAEANYDLARQVNVDAMLDLFEHLRDQNPKTRVVFASTIAVFAKPLPDPVIDTTPTGPTMIYGAQKLMMEVALSNFAAKGWLDGVSLRPSGVMARDGADAALKSAFLSRLFWCIKRGEDIALPVAPGNQTWLTSVNNVAENFIHGAMIDDIGDNRAFTLPALTLTFAGLVDALRRKFPQSTSEISFDPDPETVALFGSYPNLQTHAADALGFTRDANADALVTNSMT